MANNINSEIVYKCREGNKKAMQSLYEAYKRRMLGVCLRYTNDAEEAKDLMHDGFVKVFTSLDKWKEEIPFEGWLTVVIRNNAINSIRKQGRLNFVNFEQVENQVEYEDINLNEKEDWIKNISAEDAIDLINSLPEKYKVIINLYALEGMSHKEIAEMLGTTEGTSKSQLSRARQQLIQLVRENQKKKEKINV